MITLASALPCHFAKKASAAYILSLKKAFGDTPLDEDCWVQTDDEGYLALLAKNGGRLYVCSGGYDLDELRDFIALTAPAEVFTEAATAAALGLEVTKSFNVLYKRGTGCDASAPIPSTAELYHALSLGADGDITLPPYEAFAPDISHRLRHSAAVAVCDETGGGLAFLYDGGGIINGIAVDPQQRGQGRGSILLSRLCRYIKGDIFVCARQGTDEFYIKNGFTPKGQAVIANGEI